MACDCCWTSGAGGGGGAGYGAGGVWNASYSSCGEYSDGRQNGATGALLTGGAGGVIQFSYNTTNFKDGGVGGALGSAGASGQINNIYRAARAGGAAGAAITGNSYITWGATGTVSGAINS